MDLASQAVSGTSVYANGLTCRTNLTKNNGLNMGITLFNKLPEQLKKLEAKHRFKNNVKKYLLQNVFYSVNEYLST